MDPPVDDPAGRVRDADRERYGLEASRLRDVLARALLAGVAPDDDTVWEVYSKVELLVAVLRFRLDYDPPGTFTKLPDAAGGSRLLEDAGSSLSKAAQEISEKRLVDAVRTLRAARNDLRSYLVSKSGSRAVK